MNVPYEELRAITRTFVTFIALNSLSAHSGSSKMNLTGTASQGRERVTAGVADLPCFQCTTVMARFATRSTVIRTRRNRVSHPERRVSSIILRHRRHPWHNSLESTSADNRIAEGLWLGNGGQ